MRCFQNVPEWDSNQLPHGYEPEVPTTTLSLHLNNNGTKHNSVMGALITHNDDGNGNPSR